MKSPVDQRRRLPISCAWACLFFGVLWWFGFPQPMTDDLFHSGAALNLAGGGDLANPLIARQQFPSHFFFVYPPVYPYTLAGWLKIFGIGAGSATAFQVLMYVLIACATIVILRRHSAPVWLEWLAPPGVTTSFLALGLRSEPLAAALVMMGFALSECEGGWPVFPAFLLMFLGGATSPRFSVFSVVLLLLAGCRLWRNSGAAGRPRWSFCATVFAAWLAAGLIFLWLIDFKAGEFLRTFHFHSSVMVGASKINLLMRYLNVGVGITRWPAIALIPVLLFLSLRKPLGELTLLALALLGVLPVLVAIGGLGVGTHWYFFLPLFLLAASAWRRVVSAAGRAILFAAVLCALLLANSKLALNICGLATGRINCGVVGERERALALRSTPEHPVLLDSDTARYVYDYRIPPGFIDWSFAAPFPAELVTETKLREGDIFVLGPDSVDILNGKNYLNVDVPVWSPLRSRKWAFHRNPCQAFVIPANQCREPNPVPASPAQ